MPVTGLDHCFTLRQAQVRGVTSRGVISGKFGRDVRVAAVLEQFGHLADEAFSFEKGHIIFATAKETFGMESVSLLQYTAEFGDDLVRRTPRRNCKTDHHRSDFRYCVRQTARLPRL